MTSEGEVYPKAPLVEVIFEIRFPGEPSVECRRDEIFEFVRKTMPVVLVPEPASGDPFKFRTYQYASEDHAWTVMSGINSLGFSSKRYSGFKEFRERLIPIFEFVSKRFKLNTLRRFGFRYINAIPFTREKGLIPISRFFRSKFLLSPDIAEHMEHCSITLVHSEGEGRILTRVEGLKKKIGDDEALLLDIDYFRTAGLQAQSFEEYLRESHAGAKRYFESMITDQYREFLRGSPLI